MTNTMKEAESAARELQLVAMRVGEDTFGVDIAYINTVITPQDITVVPQTPDFVLGVMNLRGKILPVLDMRARFHLSPMTEEEKLNSRIVIVQLEDFSAGLVVDEVSEVLRISESSIEPPSALLRSFDKEMILGIGRTRLNRRGSEQEEGFILLIDVRRVLTEGLLELDFEEESAAA